MSKSKTGCVPEVSQEPLCHSHLTDVLPDDHLLAKEQVHSERCAVLVHAANNECMQTWFEFEGHVACSRCFGEYLHLFGKALGEKDFEEFLQAKGPEEKKEQLAQRVVDVMANHYLLCDVGVPRDELPPQANWGWLYHVAKEIVAMLPLHEEAETGA